jgi:flagella basal body P-ring formation protein FlgA
MILSVSSASADSQSARAPSIRIQGRSDVIVTEPEIRLGDIAHIDSASVGDDQKIVQLRTLSVGKSPRAGDSAVIDGATILEQMRSAGIRLDSVLYSLPRQVKVTRAFREVSTDELQKALDSFLMRQDKHLDIKKIVMEQPVKIPTDSFGIEVVGLQATQPGHFGVDYRSVAGADEVRFQMKALADEWRLMPVAVRPLKKGDVIGAADVQLNRINSVAVSREMVEELGDIVGKTLTRDVGQGEMFQAKAVILPPVITAGSRVSMMYRHGLLEASAAGVALESGAVQQEIKVRNEGSQKVVTARVVDKGLVEVEAR